MQIPISASTILLSVLAASPVWAQATPSPESGATPAAVQPFVPRFARDVKAADPVTLDDCDKPVYPKSSLRNEETGYVQILFKIGADGAILGSSIQRGSGFPELDNAARVGFSTCKFRPASINGRAVMGYGPVGFTFTLD